MNNHLSKVAALSYLVLEVSDLDRWEHLLVNVAGLQIGSKRPDRITFRMDNYEHRLILTQGPLDDVKAFGWEVADEDALEGVARQIEAAGIPIEEASKEEADERFVRRFFRCKDHDGNQVEICYAPRVSRRPFVSTVVEHGFVTGQQGLGHFVHVIKNEDDQKTVDFYKKQLGLSIADHVRQTFPSGHKVDVAFMHCHNKRHHTVAAFKFPEVKKQIHHFMIEVHNQQDFGRIHDLCRAEGYPLMMSVGMHPNSHALSFYIQSPSGFGFEISWGGVLIGPDWTVREYDLLDSWGHEWEGGKH